MMKIEDEKKYLECLFNDINILTLGFSRKYKTKKQLEEIQKLMYEIEDIWTKENNIKLDYMIGFSFKSEWEREFNEKM